VKRSLISMSISLLLASLIIVPALAQGDMSQMSSSLHQAVVDGDLDLVKSLISKGADVNLRNRMSWTPLHTAIRNRQKAIVEWLIDKGADVNAKDGRGQTPLHFAIDTSQKDVVERLIEKGADVNAMSGRAENALSLAKKKGNTEITDLLVKHGAKEPILEDLEGDRYYSEQGNLPVGPPGGIQHRGGVAAAAQSPVVEVDILADPNEIKARVKTFEGLEETVEAVARKSQSELRQWEQKKYDNRTYLMRAVQKQFEDEVRVIQKVALEEKVKKTTGAIDSVLSRRQDRFKKVYAELVEQKRQATQPQSARTRTRGRTSGRTTRGRYPQRGQTPVGSATDPLYDRGGVMPGTSRPQGAAGAAEQLDAETENEIRQWLQATTDNRADLAKAVHQQIRAEISSVRVVAVEEQAKKTTAAIDGLLLARQTRFDAFVKKMEEQNKALQQAQDPRSPGGYGDPSQRYQGGRIQQDSRSRGRVRRR